MPKGRQGGRAAVHKIEREVRGRGSGKQKPAAQKLGLADVFRETMPVPELGGTEPRVDKVDAHSMWRHEV